MLRPIRLLPLLLLLGCSTFVQSHDSAVEHMQSNIEKMAQLTARWIRRHPVTYPPLSADAKAYLDSLPKETVDKSDYPESIMDINGADAGKLIEGDIVPSDEDIAEMEERLREDDSVESTKRPRRGASYKRAQNWPIDKPIPFKIAPGYSDWQNDMIRDGLKAFKENTCIEFEESDAPGAKMEFLDVDGKCKTDLGDQRQFGNNHLIAFGQKCFRVSTVQHETMHALGIGHTMNRPDRDQYMDFNAKDLNGPQMAFQYHTFSWEVFDNHSLPYEYNSVMHYGSTAGSINNMPILIPKNRDYIRSVGGSHGPTFYDWKAINIRYDCIGKNCTTEKVCQNGGYQHPRDCNRCACPIWFAGDSCERDVNATHLQSGVPQQFTFQTPYSAKQYFSNVDLEDFSLFDKELHVIRAPKGSRIRVTLNKIDPHKVFSCMRECDFRAVEIVDGDMLRVGKRFCCYNTTGTQFLSTSNVIGYQVYSRPGMGFTSDVTFAIEPATTQPTESPPTLPPSEEDDTIGPSESEETISEETETTEDPPEDPQNSEPETDESQTNDSEAIEQQQLSNPERAKRQAINTPAVWPMTEEAPYQTTHTGTRAARTEQHYTVNPTDTPQKTTDVSTEKHTIDEILEFFKSVSSDLLEDANRFANYIRG